MLTLPVVDEGVHRSVKLPQMLLLVFHFLEFVLKPLTRREDSISMKKSKNIKASGLRGLKVLTRSATGEPASGVARMQMFQQLIS